MDLFAPNGAHVLVDGQFGSTGKGLYASYLASEAFKNGVRFTATISNAGPNSGHTFYHEGHKHVLKQLPTFAVKMSLLTAGFTNAVLSAGAIIDPAILKAEAERYPLVQVYVHPNAAVIDDAAKIAESGGSIAAVAGTRSGTGAAVARKVFREAGAIWGNTGSSRFNMPANVITAPNKLPIDLYMDRVFVEVSQGFSLGLNSEFYPKVTSRECTVMQAIADARIAPRFVARTFMVIRTFPIRVGNFEGFSSGDCYFDQHEVDWDSIGVEPELTTVTKRVRRVFTFSNAQFKDALDANRPDFVLVNFMNYLKEQEEQDRFIRRVRGIADPFGAKLMFGFGPNDNDITPF